MTRTAAACALCPDSRLEAYLEVSDPEISPERFAIVRCASCGLFFANPRPPAEELIHYYPENYSPYAFAAPKDFLPQDLYGRDSWKARFKRALLRRCYGYPVDPAPSAAWALAMPLLRVAAHGFARFPRFVRGGRLLEVGCSTGAWLSLCRGLGWKVAGVELNAKAAEFARKRLGIEVFTGELARAKLPDSSFDAVALSHVLEHLPDPLSALREVRRVTKPGGSLYLSVPNLAALEPRVFGRYWDAWEVPRHLYHFTPSTLRRIVERAGFELLDLRGELFNNGLDVGLSLRLLARARGWKRVERALSNRAVRIVAAFYSPLGVPLAALGLGTRLLLHAKKP